MGSLYALLCASIIGGSASSYQNACHHALTAGFYPYQLDTKLEQTGRLLQARLERHTGRTPIEGAAAIYTLGVKRQVRLQTRRIPLVDRAVFTLNQNSGTVSLEWSFK